MSHSKLQILAYPQLTDSHNKHLFIYCLRHTGSRHCDKAILNSFFQTIAIISQVYAKQTTLQGYINKFQYTVYNDHSMDPKLCTHCVHFGHTQVI